MSGKVKFFDATDPFGLADWEVQGGPNPNRTKQRAGALNKHGNEFAHAQFGTQDSGSVTYIAKKFTGFLTVPNVGHIANGWHIDSWTVTYNQKGYPSLSINCHKHISGTVDANCREYAPSFKVPARAIGIPTVIHASTGEGVVFGLAEGAVVGIRGMTLSMSLGGHVDEDDNEGNHFASDNYDGQESISVEFTGDVDPAADFTLDGDWTDDNLSRGGGNTVVSTTSLTATHHIAHVDGTGTAEAAD